ncbi:hypothetical protein D8674_008941 [Pyrus ussuriensis x Pyrus communis]|uniref:Disease resistance protein n=1 Tax=Pyrus ussuriensis x Pyrus communis TaxID=2448454 RepID=A0A5N5HZ67_9ROSA|nr:hypothetical protein D8674_008941 [Pyrus ussuriensis x Pyrus communis]
MAQEIEHYLMDKFRNGLDGKDKSLSKIPRYNQFQEIKTLLEEIFSSDLPVESSTRDKLYYLNNFLNRELLTINRIRRELSKIKRELKVITQKRDHPKQDQEGAQASSQDRELLRWTTRSMDASKVYGFDEDVISMKKLLFQQGSDDRFGEVGFVGGDGIGKTTLFQLLFDKQEVKNTFLPTCVSFIVDLHCFSYKTSMKQ